MGIRSLTNLLVITVLLLISVGLSVAPLEFSAGYLYDRAGPANGKRMVDLYLGRTPEMRASAKEAEKARSRRIRICCLWIPPT